MIKLIASDMDGTLLNDQMEVSQENVQAIKKAQEAGIEFLIATGRGLVEAKPFLDKGNIKTGFITLNGAEVYNTDLEVVDTYNIDIELVKDISGIFDDQNIYYELVTNKGIYSNNYQKRLNGVSELMKILNPDLSAEEALKTSEEKLKIMTTKYIDSYDQILNDDSYTVLKMIAFDDKGREYLTDVIGKYSNADSPVVITSSSVNNIEINDRKAQKGIALLNYAKEQGYDKNEVMSIGDNLNDYSMIEMAGVGVAMANAIPEIKAIANEQTGTNLENGVASIIYRAIDGL
ncbi:Cof-type HAD-IIB family hydrolase [Lactobacillus sp. YT155]|uniref:Cof-type HAD-IIB family hydrolase n=1 Tax=Lactobacillus sp. YT155 TaxID=3060955 RepID=UPI00265F36BF|nr:Cof-type HAD-IIB family hydrolase [Lactobacillus sp. YT155]MDO1605075.1 Cof-type HAD-IIB family hydrolase [Lactobacillus sp. YT155]